MAAHYGDDKARIEVSFEHRAERVVEVVTGYLVVPDSVRANGSNRARLIGTNRASRASATANYY
jgi:hypothetical protein